MTHRIAALTTAASLCAVALPAAHAGAATDRSSGPPVVRTTGAGSVLPNTHGFSVSTDLRSGELTRVRVRFDRGFAVRPSSSDGNKAFGSYELTYGSDQLFGSFFLPKEQLSHHMTLVARRASRSVQTKGDATLKATLTTGTRPVLVISGFPHGARRLDFSTVGAGTDASRTTSPCRKKLRAVTGSMLSTLGDGSHVQGVVAPGVLCGVG